MTMASDDMSLPAASRQHEERQGFSLHRALAMLIKEFLQLRRDRITLSMMLMMPLTQLFLFGYAINSNPRHLPAAILLQEDSDAGRAILMAFQNTAYFDFIIQARSETEFDRLIAAGKVQFGIEVPAHFERDLRRGDKPSVLVAADATDPTATGSALSAANGIIGNALKHLRGVPPEKGDDAYQIITQSRYNPAGVMQINIVPGLLGVILSMTMLLFTALSVTRERERGTMESLLAMPIRPVEIMLGKIAPYVVIGFVQAMVIIGLGIGVFGVPMVGSLGLLAGLSAIFIAANLSIGYTISTVAQSQLQAMQMTFMFFMPNMLLSGFMFPFAGMPAWARMIGELLPLTHFIRIVRGILLKGTDLDILSQDAGALVAAMLLTMILAVLRFRQTLD